MGRDCLHGAPCHVDQTRATSCGSFLKSSVLNSVSNARLKSRLAHASFFAAASVFPRAITSLAAPANPDGEAPITCTATAAAPSRTSFHWSAGVPGLGPCRLIAGFERLLNDSGRRLIGLAPYCRLFVAKQLGHSILV